MSTCTVMPVHVLISLPVTRSVTAVMRPIIAPYGPGRVAAGHSIAITPLY